jgi:hypothetical protein
MKQGFEGALGVDIDEVDAFGLEGHTQLGAAKARGPMTGVIAGAGLSTIAAIGARQFGRGAIAANSELVGFSVGAAASAALMLSKNKATKSAGMVGLASAFLSTGLRALEGFMFRGTSAAGWRGPVIEPTTAFMGSRGMGMVDIQPTTAFLGEGGGQMPQLVGASLQAASDHVQLVGGPQLSQHSSNWGATHFTR